MDDIIIDELAAEMALLITNTIESIIKTADKHGVNRDYLFKRFTATLTDISDGYSIAHYDLNGPRHPLADKN